MPYQNTNKYNEICYKHNHLTDVIARVDFLSPIDNLGKKVPKKLSNLIKVKFPIPEPRTIIAKELQISKNGVREDPKKEITEWRFFNKDKDKNIVISPNVLLISYKKYKTYEVLKQDFFSIIESIFRIFDEAQGQRVGLRYINNISLKKGDPFDWKDLISEKLLCNIDFYTEKDKLARIFNEIELNLDDFNIKFKYGLYNPDYPARIVKKSFILDFDAYHVGVLDSDEIMNNLDVYHSKIQELFEMSIKNQLRNQLNGR